MKKGIYLLWFSGAENVIRYSFILLFSFIAFYQASGNDNRAAGSFDVTVSGTITDSSGAPLAGVSIKVRGAAMGTQTDASGHFSLTVPDNAVLVISYVGYETQEVSVSGRSTISISLQPSRQALDQVVVIGYGTANKRDLTGSISTVKGREVADRPATNPISSIQGKVAGVTIVNNGRPGAQPDVRIRGTNSINSVGPLYVVDGIFNDNINFVNPADIE